MKKIFLDALPHKYGIGANKDKLVIDWRNSKKCKAKFIYNNIEGEIKILDYNKGNVLIQWKEHKQWMSSGHLTRCKLGNILGFKTTDYRYNVGDIVTNINSGKLQILKQIKISYGREKIDKGYEYRCLICGNEDIILEGNLNNHKGCNVCSNQKVIKGINDVATTNPNLAKLLANPNDGYKYTEHSNHKLNWKCSRCGNIIKNKEISNINNYGLSCPKCSDGISYPEKFMYDVLQQLLGDKFIYQLTKTTFEWCDKYKYDFYFKINNKAYIIETHGIQHYRYTGRGRSLLKEQENDKIKKKLALKNGIKEKNYIVIDCRKSDIEFIKKNIMNNKLSNLLDFSKINWSECLEYANNNLVRQVCYLWNKDSCNNTIAEIGKKLKLDRSTICRYLNQGSKIGWCDYDGKSEQKKNNRQNGKNRGKKLARKVICLNTKEVFNSMIEVEHKYNICQGHISNCCRNKRKSAGKDKNNNKLKWMYYEEYVNNLIR